MLLFQNEQNFVLGYINILIHYGNSTHKLLKLFKTVFAFEHVLFYFCSPMVFARVFDSLQHFDI